MHGGKSRCAETQRRGDSALAFFYSTIPEEKKEKRCFSWSMYLFNLVLTVNMFCLPGQETESNHLTYLLAGVLSDPGVEERFVFLFFFSLHIPCVPLRTII